MNDKILVQQYVGQDNRIRREVYVRLSPQNTINELELLSDSTEMPIVFKAGVPYYLVVSMTYDIETYDLPRL